MREKSANALWIVRIARTLCNLYFLLFSRFKDPQFYKYEELQENSSFLKKDNRDRKRDERVLIDI